jgi:adenosylcobinamide kinase/adenosylcobinamide-phosphate guanylyltransferase
MSENTSTLILGGARSGKSRRALELAGMQAAPHVFIATLEPGDEEMVDRIARHKAERGDDWQTVEAPRDLAAAIIAQGDRAGVILVDCLTLWVTNLLLAGQDTDAIAAAGEALGQAVGSCSCPLILVSNEVGYGVVPDNRLGRDFRDAAGTVNQKIAAACERVELVVAGIPVTVKP